MRVSVSLKLIVLSCFIYFTWLVTSSIIAQQPKVAKQSKAAVKPPLANTGRKALVERISAQVANGRQGFHPNLATSNSLKEFSSVVQGNFVSVHASVSMMSRLHGPFHLWRLKVTDLATNAVVSDVPYSDQRFQIDESGIMNPNFDDMLQLPNGKYQVALTLYRIPDGVEIPEMLGDKRWERSSTIIKATKNIEVN